MYRIRKQWKKALYNTKLLLQKTKGELIGNSIKAYWFDSTPNFGDQLNVSLLKYYGFTPLWAPKDKAEIIAIGSVLNDLPEDYSGIILGAGLQTDITKSFPNATILALRGKLTKERIISNQNAALGDPGLLADRLVTRQKRKRYLIGIVPHYVDKNNKQINELQSRLKNSINVIDVQRSPKKVISEIDKCNYILSSSLHGLIVADSLGIPNGWLILSNKVIGNGFKFRDYFSSLNIFVEPQTLSGKETITELINKTHPVSEEIPLLKENLDILFVSLKDIITGKIS